MNADIAETLENDPLCRSIAKTYIDLGKSIDPDGIYQLAADQLKYPELYLFASPNPFIIEDTVIMLEHAMIGKTPDYIAACRKHLDALIQNLTGGKLTYTLFSGELKTIYDFNGHDHPLKPSIKLVTSDIFSLNIYQRRVKDFLWQEALLPKPDKIEQSIRIVNNLTLLLIKHNDGILVTWGEKPADKVDKALLNSGLEGIKITGVRLAELINTHPAIGGLLHGTKVTIEPYYISALERSFYNYGFWGLFDLKRMVRAPEDITLNYRLRILADALRGMSIADMKNCYNRERKKGDELEDHHIKHQLWALNTILPGERYHFKAREAALLNRFNTDTVKTN
ncbi:MAG: hypothetical protein AABZ39_04935 [Spirochaetota bacterium]